MSTYYLAPSLVALRDEVNKRYPKRDKTSDGWIGDTSHAARTSDHNPDWSCGGVVRAIDIDVDDNDPDKDIRADVLRATIGDPRVWYVISNGVIYSRTYGWRARTYTGSNTHFHHVHVSLVHTKQAETDCSQWLDPVKPFTRPLPISLEDVREQMQAARVGGKVKQSVHVKRLQRVLNEKTKAGLKVDGYAGPATLDAYGAFERSIGVLGRPRIPDEKNLAALLRARYRLVA